jgi:hypothetical protein
MNDIRTPNVQPLRERFERLKKDGLKDLKFWYVGGTGAAEDASVDALCAEVGSLLDNYESKEFIDIPAEKLK